MGRERETIEASLRALDTDHVDLWLIHWPPSAPGDSIPMWRELLAARDESLTRAVGVSNYSISQIDELIQATEETPAVNQIRWSPSLYDRQTHAAHRDRGVVLEGYSPFKTSDLSRPGADPDRRRRTTSPRRRWCSAGTSTTRSWSSRSR